MKKITKLMFIPVVAPLLFACGGANTDGTDADAAAVDTIFAGTYAVNTNESKVEWHGDMLAIGGVSLYSHDGTLNVNDGNIRVENGMITGGTVVVNMSSMMPTDANYTEEQGKGKSDLVGHLSSPDFFAVDSFPQAIFEITGQDGNNITGNLTVRGITKPHTITDVMVEETLTGLNATGNLVFNRQDFNVRFSMANAMDVRDKIVSDDITLKFEIVAAEDTLVAI